ncbi:aminotransferase class I/II-fold pyridoxal phosphate-dependent enzyme [Hymenobacter sp. NST-14]|uniref:pyridoxal phosphate-dependent aminotransferase n=1 Tax=Hymenobacter piscis TaxID=2839984 RepID=UPI001C01269E|nr:aminotransferase class I/II-fold pyridoxal phosphate-dependent enzyme [Hymenobacter piscis]MBT9393743.1 aminotransferase class I/II-fold pyridoxal phosphate-dependent enzyme [Hymenobacter piscis]
MPISLASGYGNFAVPAAASAAAARLLGSGPLEVLPAAGSEALRTALVAAGRPAGAVPLSAENVVVTPGAKAALFALLKTVLRPGDEVLLPTPNWFGFAALVEQAGGRLRTLPLNPADDYALRADQLRAALSERTRVLLLSNPNNPSGRLYRRAELTEWLTVTRDFPDLFVLSDEIYNLIHFVAEPAPSLLDFPDPRGRHLVVNGFSKSLALIGWGVGYLVAPAAVARACADWQHATGCAVPAPTQAAALAVTEQAAVIGAKLVAQLRPNRARLLDFLAARPAIPPARPTATYYAYPDLRAYLRPGLPPAEASAELITRLHQAGVDVVDGTSCGTPGFARISYAIPETDLTEALRRMSEVLGN